MNWAGNCRLILDLYSQILADLLWAIQVTLLSLTKASFRLFYCKHLKKAQKQRALPCYPFELKKRNYKGWHCGIAGKATTCDADIQCVR